MKITACYNIYNEKLHILDYLESVANFVDEIVIVDGAFEGYPDGTGTSTDGSIDIIHDFMLSTIGSKLKVKLFTRDSPWPGMSKVERYMAEVDDGDWILRMNGDEIVESKHYNIRQALEDYVDAGSTFKLPMYQLMEYRPPLGKHYDWIPKLIQKTPTLKLTNQHIALTNDFYVDVAGEKIKYTLNGLGRNRVTPLIANIPSNIIRVRHMTEHRSPERQQQNYMWLKHFNTKLRYA